MREDDLAGCLVEHFGAAFDDGDVLLEEPYDHYGNRGSVDVYARVGAPRTHYLIELKSDAALRHATGANEILRQYRRMERYFFKDDEHSVRQKLVRDGPGVRVLLLFAPTRACVEHVDEYREHYGSIDPEADVEGVPARRTVAFLTNLDAAAEGNLGFLSVNEEAPFGSSAFFDAVPRGSGLAAALREADSVAY